MTDGGLMAGSSHAVTVWRLPRRHGIALAFLVLVLSVLGPRSPEAHETIDADGVNAILAATDAAAARLKNVAGSAAEGEAMFALGMAQAEATAVLDRDLAAHGGQLTFNGQSLQKALAQRNLGPRFDDAIGRYRLPTASHEQAVHLSLAAPDALRARFELLKAGMPADCAAANGMPVIASLVLAGLFPQSCVLFIIGFASWLGLCVYVAGIFEGNRAYGAVLSGYTVAVVAVTQIDSPQNIFLNGVNRGAAIVVGVMALALVNDLFLAPNLHTILSGKVAAVHQRV